MKKGLFVSNGATITAHVSHDSYTASISIDGVVEQNPEFLSNEPFFSVNEEAEVVSALSENESDGLLADASDLPDSEGDTENDQNEDSLVVKNGLPEYRGDSGSLLDGVDRLGKLGTFHWGREIERDDWFQGSTARHEIKGTRTEPLNPGPGPDPGPEPVILDGNCRLLLVMREDGRPSKYLPSDPNNPDSQSDRTYEEGYDPDVGMPLAFFFESLTGENDEVVYFHSFTPTSLPDLSQGTIYYNGIPLELGVTINIPNMNGFTFVPSPYFSGTITMDFTYVLATERTGPASNIQQGEAIIVVDSVADLASASTEVSGETAKGNDREIGEAVIVNGWATQEAAADDTVLVTFTITVQFYDLDGSEAAWIDIALPPGFRIPEGAGMELIENANGRFARIYMPDLRTLQESGGLVEVPVTLEMDTNADSGAKSLNVHVYTHETDGLDSDGFQAGNNLAGRYLNQDIQVDILPGDFTVQVGWAYEGNKSGGSATEDITRIGLDQDSTTENGAPLVFLLENGFFIGGTITIDPAFGTLYHDGVALVSEVNGVYTLSADQLNGGRLTFMPSGHTDGDVPLHYALDAAMDNGSRFSFSGNTTVVIDAVADGAIVETVASLADADDSTVMMVTVNAFFADVDGSEFHYILVEYLEGWSSPDPCELMTVYFDANGNPMQPTGYLADGSGYAYEGAAYSKTYFRFDVTEESLDANGNSHGYSLRLTPPDGARDVELSVLTMAEERVEGLADREYDIGNNVAWTSDTVGLDLADANATMSATPAYENHNPEQHLGATERSETDGVITVTLENNCDTINAAEGQQIALTFTYDGPGFPGSFTCGMTSQTYTYGGSANYTLIPGTTNQYRIVIDLGPDVMGSGETSFTLRYNPPVDDDTDLTDLSVSIPIVSGSGHTGTTETGLDRLVVDAVANKPEALSINPTYEDGLSAVASGGTMHVNVSVRFGDYEDGSEQHYLVFDLDSGFASIDFSSFPEGSIVVLSPAEAAAAGLTYTDGARYVVVQVSNEYLGAHGGEFNATIKAGVDEVDEDGTLDLTFLAVSKDEPTDAGEVTGGNNMAVEEVTGSVQVNTVTSKLVLHAGMAYENGTPHAHIGDGTVNGAGALAVSGLDAGEMLTSLTLSWPAGSGSLLYNGQAIEPGETVIGDITLRYDPDSGTITVFSNSGQSCVSDEVGKLAFLPAENYSDADVSLEYSGTIVDSGSGMQQDFTAEDPAIVVVDAVAQKPSDVEGSVTYSEGQTAAGEYLTVTAEATFRDTDDGSEAHYLLIQVKSYLDGNALLTQYGGGRVLVGYDAEGNPLTPAPDGVSWLDPNATGDSRVIPSSTKGFIRIPVDGIIGAYDPDGEATQVLGEFTITRNTDGSFTVSLTTDIPILSRELEGDINGDTLIVGGMSEEHATVNDGDGAGGREGQNNNNAGYDFSEVVVNVAKIETTHVGLLMGWAYEHNAPGANKGDYSPANGAGLLAVRTAIGNGDYVSEQLSITFTYNALYMDDSGEWVLPGIIIYDFPGGAEPLVSVDPVTGVVTVVVVISMEDTASIIANTDVSKDAHTRAGQVNDSHIRFIPSDNHNEADVKIGYTVDVTETATGDTSSVGDGSATVAIDAVADKPVITDVHWDYGVSGEGGNSAFGDDHVLLRLTVEFPDGGTNGQTSEGHYILVRQNTDMDLSPDFIAAVKAAGYSIESYVVAGDSSPYYRIPAAFFEWDPVAGVYRVAIPMVMTKDRGDGTFNPDLTVLAQAVVETPHGKEVVTDNNAATEGADIPDLNFAFISTIVKGGQSAVYEGDTPNAHIGDYTPGQGVEFSLGLKVGESPAGGGKEQVSDIVFEYNESHGTLAYFDGERWVDVPSGGSVPPEYSDRLRYTPKNVRDGTGDIDQDLHYTLTVTEPATGQEKTIEGDYRIIVDAVAEQPTNVYAEVTGYGNGETHVVPGGSVSLSLSATFPDHTKNGDSHSAHYFLVQVPGDGWTVDYPGAELYIHDGITYFRLPVDAGLMDENGNVNIHVTLTAPPDGYALYDNAESLQVGALTTARDPNGSSSHEGDGEVTWNNNWAFSDQTDLDISWNPGESFFTIDPLYENNNPRGNELGEDGRPVQEEDGGKVHIAPELNGQEIVTVRVTWNTSMGDLYVNGEKVSPIMIDSENGYYDIPSSSFDDVYFRVSGHNDDTDWDSVTAEAFGKEGELLGTGSWTPVVDAVAQVPTDIGSEAGYTTGSSGSACTAAIPGEEVIIVLTATFNDLGGDSDRFMLIEARPGWSLPEGTEYTIITAPDGRQYFQIPVPDSAIDPLTGEARMEIPIITPAEEGKGGETYELGTGAMTSRNPSDDESRSDNNVSYNLTGEVTVTTEEITSDPTLRVTDTYAATDENGSGGTNPDLSANLFVTGMEDGDYLSEITLTYSTENGDVTYNGISLVTGGLPGVSVVTNPDGTVTVTITDTTILDALVNGSAENSGVRYMPATYNDSDVNVSATFEVKNRHSADEKSTGNDATIIVDAVALQPKDVVMSYSDDYSGACGSAESVEFTVTGTFMDMDNPNAHHYLAIQNLSGWFFEGTLPPEITIQSYDGMTYYVLDVEAALASGSPYLTAHGGGRYGFTLPLTSPNDFSNDAAGADSITGGAVVVVTPQDNEVSYHNNTAMGTDSLSIDVGVVTTEEVNFVIGAVVEDDGRGTPVTIKGADWNALMDGNERVVETKFLVTGNFTGFVAGEQVGTFIYNGKAYALVANGDGTASAHVFYGASGFDPSLEFSLIWGTVVTGPDERALYDDEGNPIVSSWNHTGSNMTVATSSTVVDNASTETVTDVGGSGKMSFVPTADAPTAIDSTDPVDPVAAGEEVSFIISGTFEDVDGSEKHYFLVEQLPGWNGDYDIVNINGIAWFKIPIADSRDANPSVLVTLTTPEDVNADAHSLRVGGMSEDGSSSAYSIAEAPVTVHTETLDAMESEWLLEGDEGRLPALAGFLDCGEAKDDIVFPPFPIFKTNVAAGECWDFAPNPSQPEYAAFSHGIEGLSLKSADTHDLNLPYANILTQEQALLLLGTVA